MAPSIPNDIYQYSLYSAFHAGLHSGGPPVAFLTNHGTHGTGTFDDGESEMIQIDSNAYKLTKDGKAQPASAHEQLPFVMVNVFQPKWQVRVPDGTTLAGLRLVFEDKGTAAAGKNTPLPFAVHGSFKRMQLGLEHTLEDMVGTVFGYSIPVWQGEISGTGIQCCFLSEDKKTGGRVLDFESVGGAVVEWAKCGRFHLGFPEEEAYETLTL